MYILIVHASEMVTKALINDNDIKGEIKDIQAITENVLIISTSFGIYTVSL